MRFDILLIGPLLLLLAQAFLVYRVEQFRIDLLRSCGFLSYPLCSSINLIFIRIL